MPFADCYCRNVTGSSIPKIAKFCMEGNSDCPVYEKIATGKIKQAGIVSMCTGLNQNSLKSVEAICILS